MITLAEIKAFLNITVSTIDSQLTTFIAMAKKRIDTLGNRKFEYQLHTEYYNSTESELYLKNYPIDSIETLQYYDGDEYVDLIDGTTEGVADTIANTVEIQDSKIILRKGYTFYTDMKITYYAGYKATKVYKTISAISQSTTFALVTIGAHSYEVGTVFYIDGVTGFLNNPNGAFVIEEVTATQVKFTFDLGTGSYTSGGTAEFDSTLTNTTPEDIKTALLYLAAKYYWDSPVCDSPRLGLTSKNFNAGSSGGVSYEDIEIKVKEMILPYKNINI